MASLTYSPALVISAGAIFPPVTGLFVALRLYTRRTQGIKIGPDDWLLVPAWLLIVGMCAAIIAGAALGGLGTLTPKVVDSLGSSYAKRITREVLWATELMQILSLGCVKLSFLFFYRRIFNTGHGKTIFNYFNLTMIAIIIMWTLGFFFGYLFECGTNFWAYYGGSQAYEVANCVKTTILNNAFAISDMLTDLIIIVTPIPFVVKLQMTAGRKLAVIGVFLLGGLTLAMSIMRMVIYIESNAVLFGGHVDVDMLTTGSIYWSTLESGIGLIAACLPVLYRVLVTSGIESMINSVRSAVSLRTMSPRSSENKSKASPAGSKFSKNSKAMKTSPKKKSLDGDSQASDVDMISTMPEPGAATHREEHEMSNIGQALGSGNHGHVWATTGSPAQPYVDVTNEKSAQQV